MNQNIKEKVKKTLIDLDKVNKNNYEEIDFFNIEVISYNLFMVFYLSDKEIDFYKNEILKDIKKAEDIINSA